jgi:hypothetical protein
MIVSRRQAILSAAVTLGLSALPKFAFARSGDPLYGVDTDNDRTIDLWEAKKAAIAMERSIGASFGAVLRRRNWTPRIPITTRR